MTIIMGNYWQQIEFFNTHINDMYKEIRQKISALSRITPFMEFS